MAAASFSPPGELSSMLYGKISYKELVGYNNRLEPCRINANSNTSSSFTNPCTDSTPSGSVLDLNPGYADSSGHNNGMVMSVANKLDSGRTETVTYDALNQLTSITSQATSGADCWGQNFLMDPVANLFNMNVTQCTGGSLGVTVNQATNQFNSYGYDNAGNMTSDGLNTYAYNAQNLMKQATASGVVYTYTYDGGGLRVEKSYVSGGSTVGTLYWRDVAGNTLAETDLSGNTVSEYIFFGGQRVARRDTSGNIFFYYADQLGTTRSIVQVGPGVQTPTPCYDADFTAYGQEMAHTNTCPQNYKFTGYERDTETGLDYAFGRYYSSRLGRFMSPDPGQAEAASGSPRTWNGYAYVANNPRNFTDPSGLDGGPGWHGLQYCTWMGCNNDDSLDCMMDGEPVACFIVQHMLQAHGVESGAIAVCNGPCPENPGNIPPPVWEQYLQKLFFGVDDDDGDGGGATRFGAKLQDKVAHCLKKIQDAVNKILGTDTQYLGPTSPTAGGATNSTTDLRLGPGGINGAYNFNFFAPGVGAVLPGDCGRVASNFLGLGSSLHIVAPVGSACNPLGDPSIYGPVPGGLDVTVHMDSGNGSWSTPLGALWHLVNDVLLKSPHGC